MNLPAQFFLLIYGHLFLSFLIGVTPTLIFFRHNLILRGNGSCLPLVAITALNGFLLLPFTVFNIAIILEKTVSEIIYPVVFILLVTSFIMVARSASLRTALLQNCRNQRRILGILLFILLPLSALHILWPLVQHGIAMGYAIGNDGAAYLGAIDGLQSTFWTVNKAELVLSRPLMQYTMAITGAFWQVDNYLAYGVTTSLVAFLVAGALATTYTQLGSLRNRPNATLIVFAAAATIVGLAGTFSTLYYTGTLSQYYGALPVFFALTLPLVNTRPLPILAWSLFAYSTIITMYSIGNIVVPIIITFSHLATYAWIEWKNRKQQFRHYVAAALLLSVGFLAAVAIYRYELRFIFEWASTRNLAHPYSQLRSIVITLGLFSQYLDANIPEVMYLAAALMILVFIAIACAFFRKNRRARVYLLLPIAIAAFFVAFDSHNLMLTKYRAILFPLIGMSAIFALYRTSFKFDLIVKTLGIAALAATISTGFVLFKDFYVPMMLSRNIYVSPAVSKMRSQLLALYQPGSRIYCTDFTAERHTFLRALLRPYDWQPVRASTTWPEFSYRPDSYPSWIDEFRYNYILDADDVHGPVALRNSNPNALLFEVPNVYSVYSGDAYNVEFGLEFEMADSKVISANPSVHHFSLATSATESSLYYIHPGNLPRSLHIRYRFTGSQPAKLSTGEYNIATLLPTNGTKSTMVAIDCNGHCLDRVTKFTLRLQDGRFTVDSVWFE